MSHTLPLSHQRTYHVAATKGRKSTTNPGKNSTRQKKQHTTKENSPTRRNAFQRSAYLLRSTLSSSKRPKPLSRLFSSVGRRAGTTKRNGLVVGGGAFEGTELVFGGEQRSPPTPTVGKLRKYLTHEISYPDARKKYRLKGSFNARSTLAIG